MLDYGLRIYEQGEIWKPTSYNSKIEEAMVSNGNSVVFSFYTKNQKSITKRYAKEFACPYWKYNIMVEIEKIPSFIKQVKMEYENEILIPEDKWGVGAGTTGVFLETKKSERGKSTRMDLRFIQF